MQSVDTLYHAKYSKAGGADFWIAAVNGSMCRDTDEPAPLLDGFNLLIQLR